MRALRRAARISEHVDNLGAPDPKIAIRAEKILLRHYRTEAIPSLIAACDHENPAVRFRAVWILGQSGAPEAYEPIRRLCDDLDERVHYDAVVALGIHGDERAINYLVNLMLEPSPTRPGGYALSRFGPRCISALLPCLDHEDSGIRSFVVRLLGPWKAIDDRCRLAIESALLDPNEEVCQTAQDSLLH